jgi:hypothetical protein
MKRFSPAAYAHICGQRTIETQSTWSLLGIGARKINASDAISCPLVWKELLSTNFKIMDKLLS